MGCIIAELFLDGCALFDLSKVKLSTLTLKLKSKPGTGNCPASSLQDIHIKVYSSAVSLIRVQETPRLLPPSCSLGIGCTSGAAMLVPTHQKESTQLARASVDPTCAYFDPTSLGT